MHVPDVNVLLNVSLEASSQHQAAVDWLVAAGNGAEPVAVPAMVLLSYVRIISGTGVGPARKTVDEAFAFCENVASMPAYLSVAEGPRHWRLFQETVRGGAISGADITDAYLAAFALENDATFVTFDRGFRRFPGLRLLVLE